MHFTSPNNCPCNEPQRFQCILHDLEDRAYDRFLLLTNDQISMIKYLLSEGVITDIYAFTILDEECKTFVKI